VTISLYIALGAVAVIVLRALSRRWQQGLPDEGEIPYGPPPGEASEVGA
jgi:hypothetical protein